MIIITTTIGTFLHTTKCAGAKTNSERKVKKKYIKVFIENKSRHIVNSDSRGMAMTRAWQKLLLPEGLGVKQY